jgi:5'-nucleotidase (lipoprotein e(P4) family)
MIHAQRRGYLTRVIALPALTLIVAACASGRGQPAVAPTPAPTVTYTSWVTRAAEYGAITRQVYTHATEAVTRAAAGRARGSWAVILDADETVISNLAYQLEREKLGLGFTPDSWNAWTKRREATPLPGAKAFLDHVRAMGGRLAIVTNRLESECADSRANFDKLSLAWDLFLCRPNGGPSDKNPRFAAVEAGAGLPAAQPVEVIAWVGDNILDFPALDQSVRQQGDVAFSRFGTRYFLLPNPMYGSWQ